MKTTMRFILLTAIRDKLFPALFILIFAVIGITRALAATAMLENQEMHMVMSAGLTRIIINIGVAVFVCFHVRSMYDSKEIDVMISRPLSRPHLVLGMWAGFSIVATLLCVVSSAILFLLSPISITGYITWIGSLLLECWIMVGIALFASLTNKGAVTSVMVTFTLYILGRLMAFFVATANAKMIFQNKIVNDIAEYGIELISVVIPRLDMFAHTDWLLYGVKDTMDVAFFVTQGLIFIPFVLTLAILDFSKKEF
jgi:hypothetical protein